MKQERRLYPISEQDFPELRRRNFAYIDKTRYVYQMTHSDAKYMFLSRPRRFGKLLLVSTLHTYFEGRRELFEGLAIEQLENEWAQYPVIRIDNYDGYHFTWPSPDIFNPYSLLMAMAKGKTDTYWFGSGTPTYLIEMMRKFHTLPSQIGQRLASTTDFDAPTESIKNITPLLYQSGYITIKDCDDKGIYTLDLPNREIRNGLMKSLLPYYIDLPTEKNSTTLRDMSIAIDAGDMNSALTTLQTYLLTIPYTNDTAYEGHYQQVLYIIFSLMEYYVDVEVHTATGRVDLVMQTANELYLMEIKLNANVDVAMRQIMRKNYAARFALRGLPIVKVAVNFDTVRRTITTWKIER